MGNNLQRLTCRHRIADGSRGGDTPSFASCVEAAGLKLLVMDSEKDKYDYLFKFIIIGDAGAGKSCLLHQFIDNKFKKGSSHTIGVEFGSKVITVGGRNIKLQIWDTAGQVVLITPAIWLYWFLQGDNFVQPTLPPRLPVHASIQASRAQRNQAGSSVHTKPFPPRRSTRTTCHFWQLLDLPLLAEASTFAVRITSTFASATEGCLGLGALSADFLGSAISSAIATFDVEFLAGLPRAPAFLLEAVEADWLAQIAAGAISNTETSGIANLVVAMAESGGAGMAALSEEKTVEFACGIFARVESEKLAEILAAVFRKVAADPSLLGKMSGASLDVVIKIFEQSPEARTVLLILLGQLGQEVLKLEALEVLVKIALKVLPVEELVSFLGGTSEAVLVPAIRIILTEFPQETVLEVLKMLASQATQYPAILVEFIKTAVTVLPAERLLELGRVLVSQPVALTILSESSPETLDLLLNILPEGVREGAEMLIPRAPEDLPSMASRSEALPSSFGEYELVMTGDAALSLVSNSTVPRLDNDTANATDGQGFSIDVIHVGTTIAGLSASVGVKQYLCVVLGLGPSLGVWLWPIGIVTSWAAKELHRKNFRAVKYTVEERYRSVTRSYYRGAAGALIVYDITNRDSYNHLVNWLADARTLARADISIITVGNKVDLKEKREVTFLEASRCAQENDILFLETSALTGEGVEDVFIKVARMILNKIEDGLIDPHSMTKSRTSIPPTSMPAPNAWKEPPSHRARAAPVEDSSPVQIRRGGSGVRKGAVSDVITT
eukprot:s1976_g10.t1